MERTPVSAAVKVPDGLVELAAELAARLDDDSGDELGLQTDAVTTEDGYGGRAPDSPDDTFEVVYYPTPAREPRWFLRLGESQLRALAAGKVKKLPLWRCKERECGNRYPAADAVCAACPQAMDVGDPLHGIPDPDDDLEKELLELGADLDLGHEEEDEGPLTPDALRRLLGAMMEDEDFGDPEPPPRPTPTASESTERLLALLVSKEQLELAPGASITALAAAVAPIVDGPLPPGPRAEALLEALFDREEVEEVYIDDETLVKLLAMW